MPKKTNLQVGHTTSKTYSYQLGGVALNFTLRTDEKREMRDFLVLLKRAVEEVATDLGEK